MASTCHLPGWQDRMDIGINRVAVRPKSEDALSLSSLRTNIL